MNVLEEANALRIGRIWLQPGAESSMVLSRAKELGIDVVHSGPCILKVLGYDDKWEAPQVVSSGVEAGGDVRWEIDDRFVLTITLSNGKRRNPQRPPRVSFSNGGCSTRLPQKNRA